MGWVGALAAAEKVVAAAAAAETTPRGIIFAGGERQVAQSTAAHTHHRP